MQYLSWLRREPGKRNPSSSCEKDGYGVGSATDPEIFPDTLNVLRCLKNTWNITDQSIACVRTSLCITSRVPGLLSESWFLNLNASVKKMCHNIKPLGYKYFLKNFISVYDNSILMAYNNIKMHIKSCTGAQKNVHPPRNEEIKQYG